tara:strand:+ start:2684 stop:5050 length:2367 start_codon:yes stop_codon:yes gene_type:complete
LNLRLLTSFCAKKPFIVIVSWIILIGISGYLSTNYLDSALSGGEGATIDTETKLAQKLKSQKSDLLDKQNGIDDKSQIGSGSDSLLVVSSEKFLYPSEEYLSSLNGFFSKVQNEIDKAGLNQNVGKLENYQINPSEDRTTIMISTPFVQGNLVPPLVHLLDDYSDDNFQYYFIGSESVQYAFQELAEQDLVTGETIGISVAIIILALVFGAVTAALIPVVLAVASIFVAIGLVAILGQAVDLNDFVPNIMTMMGLAVGIDYCLFILSRYKEERQKGFDKHDSIVNSGSTAGKAVMFSGLTVVFALVGMFIIPEKTFHALGVGAILVVFVAVMAGITLLPSILGILGDKVNSFKVPKIAALILYSVGFLYIAITQELGPDLLIVSGIVMLFIVFLSILKNRGISIKFLTPKDDKSTDEGGFWNTITLAVMAKPLTSMALAFVFLASLSYFYFDLEKGTSGLSALPEDEPMRVGFEILNDKYGFGLDAPANIVIDADVSSPEISKAINLLEQQMIDDDSFLEPEVQIEPTVNFAELTSLIPGDPQNQPALLAIDRLRNTIIPSAFEGIPTSSYEIYVGGISAEVVDSVKMTDDYFPFVLAIVLFLSLILLLFAFRSITISIASIIMNLLSVGASYGLLVLVFQKGFLIDLIGFQQVDQLEFWLPLFMFSILFGLSMDYHVFMLSRIKENFDETNSTDNSVAFGLRKTASIITGAALIMVAVFGGFALGDITFFQSMGFGLGAAVLIDATIVRSILVPSVMKILGKKAWYLPSWLNWLPNISIEGNENNSS